MSISHVTACHLKAARERLDHLPERERRDDIADEPGLGASALAELGRGS